MPGILILGDPHLGGGLSIGKQAVGSALNSRIIDQLDLFEWVLNQAINNSVSDIIITGDVFEDPKPQINLISLFIEWLKSCSLHNISVHIIVGNHDILRSGQFYTSPLDIISSAEIEQVFIYKKLTSINLEGISITLVPFRDRRSFNTNNNAEALSILNNQLQYEIPGMPKENIKVLIGHLSLEGSIPIGNEFDELSNELFCPVNMFNGYNYVWMGHIHRYQLMSQIPHIAHIGSMNISSFGEREQEKFVSILYADGQQKYIKIPVRPLKHLEIEIPQDDNNVMSFIENEISKLDNLNDSIIRVLLHLTSTQSLILDRKKIEEFLYNKGVFHIFRISEERKLTTISKKEVFKNIDNTMNELSAIKMYADGLSVDVKEDFIALANSIIKEFQETKS